MKSKLLFSFFILSQILTAQTFTEKTDTPFEGVMYSSIAFSDVNNDGYKDALITGTKDNLGHKRSTKLYMNDGKGNFTEMKTTPFDNVMAGSVAFSDVNGDGHEDVFITGTKDYFGKELIAKLYTNDGKGTFSELKGTPFDGVWISSVAFSDVNGDGYNDVLITGQIRRDGLENRIAKLYINNGSGTFTEKTGTPFEGVWFGSIAFSDVNGDGHNDVLITGQTNSGESIAKLYTNDGTGVFSEKKGTPFARALNVSIAFSDVNGDGHDDVLITGQRSSKRIAKLYINEGNGRFSEMKSAPFEGVDSGSIAFSDINGDGHEDVFITGTKDYFGKELIAKLYTNDGTGKFTEMKGTPFEGVWCGSIAFSDVNGDGNEDVLITGENNSNERITKLYINNSFNSSTEEVNKGINLVLTLSPNPSSSSTLHLSYVSEERNEVTIKIYNTNGMLVSQQKESVTTGPQTFSIDISTLAGGEYFLELHNGKRKGVAGFIVQ
jgi:hypothetical protein